MSLQGSLSRNPSKVPFSFWIEFDQIFRLFTQFILLRFGERFQCFLFADVNRYYLELTNGGEKDICFRILNIFVINLVYWHRKDFQDFFFQLKRNHDLNEKKCAIDKIERSSLWKEKKNPRFFKQVSVNSY